MRRAGRHISILLPALLMSTYADAQVHSSIGMITCASHFQARANWLRELEKNKDTVRLMELHAQVMLDAANASIGPTDWRMPVYGGGQSSGPPDYFVDVYVGALDEMTRFAEIGFGKTGLPLCVEDETCIACSKLLNEIDQ